MRFDVEPIFIPPGQPQYIGSVENYNGWFQPLLLQRRFARCADLKRELKRLQDTVNSQHVHRRLGGLTPAKYHKRQKLPLLPQTFKVPTQRLPIAVGRVTFIRMVSAKGNTHLLGLTSEVGKRLKASKRPPCVCESIEVFMMF